MDFQRNLILDPVAKHVLEHFINLMPQLIHSLLHHVLILMLIHQDCFYRLNQAILCVFCLVWKMVPLQTVFDAVFFRHIGF